MCKNGIFDFFPLTVAVDGKVAKHILDEDGEVLQMLNTFDGGGGTGKGQTKKVPEKIGIPKGMRLSCTSTG